MPKCIYWTFFKKEKRKKETAEDNDPYQHILSAFVSGWITIKVFCKTRLYMCSFILWKRKNKSKDLINASSYSNVFIIFDWTVNMRCKCGLSHFINFRRMNIITLTNYKQNASDWKNHLRIHIHPDLKRKTETQALIPTAESSLSMGLVAHTLLGWSGRTSPALDASWVVCTRTPPCTVFSCKTHKQTKQSLKHNLMILVISEPIPH